MTEGCVRLRHYSLLRVGEHFSKLFEQFRSHLDVQIDGYLEPRAVQNGSHLNNWMT